MATSFIAGASIEASGAGARTLWRTVVPFPSIFGETSVNEREADAYRDRCLAACGTWRMSVLLAAFVIVTRAGPPRPAAARAAVDQISALIPARSHRSGIQLPPSRARLRPLVNLAGTLPASIIFDMGRRAKELILSIFMRLFEEDSYRTFPMRVSHCRPTAPIPGMMCSACWHGPEPAGADDHSRLVKGALLGFRCDPVSAARVADAAVRTEVPDRREL